MTRKIMVVEEVNLKMVLLLTGILQPCFQDSVIYLIAGV